MATDIQPQFQKTVPFEVYRYQLVVNKSIQLALDSQFQTPEEIRANKNKTFQELISNPKFKFLSSNSQLNTKLVYSKGDLSIFKLAVKRSLKHDLPDFTEEKIDNYPKFLVAINNHPDVQKIAIQENKKAFSKSHAVSKILEESIENKIKSHNLGFYLEPLFNKQKFWDLVGRFKGKVTQVSFDLVSPNLANITKNLKIDLKQIYEDTNAHKTKLELTSDKNGHLAMDETSKLVSSIVDYSSEGGGNIAVKVAGYNKKFHTSESITTFNIDEQLLKGTDWDALDEAFREILI